MVYYFFTFKIYVRSWECVQISVNQKSTKVLKCLIYVRQIQNIKKVDHSLESSVNVQSFIDVLNVIHQLSEIKDDIQVVSQLPCLFGRIVLTFLKNDGFVLKTIVLF